MTSQKFVCDVCGLEKTLPESPTGGKAQIRTGCPNCEALQPFFAVGSAPWAIRACHRQQFRTRLAGGGR